MTVQIEPIDDSPLWAVRYGYSVKLNAVCQSVPGMWYSYTHRTWVGHRDAVRYAGRAFLKAGVAVNGRLPRADDWQHDALSVFPHIGALDSYQEEAVRFLLARSDEGALLSLVMGAGKSACALRAARSLEGRTLIVVPASVRSSWTLSLIHI